MTPSVGRVLVVDDSPSVRYLMTVTLQMHGLQVHTAVDGRDCMEQVTRIRPDLVTLDVEMPRMDGLAAAGLLRADPSTRAIPIVLVTADSSPEARQRAEELAVDAYLPKPFKPAELVDIVLRLTEHSTDEPRPDP